jgi:quercetin dioxygenase-like cupin family protein
MTPKRANIYRVKEWFRVLVTTKRTQTAVMKLGVGQSTGDTAEAHEKSDQVLLVVEGELLGGVGNKRFRMKAGDTVVIPHGVKHKFTNGEKFQWSHSTHILLQNILQMKKAEPAFGATDIHFDARAPRMFCDGRA